MMKLGSFHYPSGMCTAKQLPVKLSRYVCTMMELCVLSRIIECFYFMDIWGNIISLSSFPVPLLSIFQSSIFS
ncbi:hypothetical protein VIGAN_03088700 [Vigna angularis var. angularis]|uniref:Uncharacterized protein n=1 Tax=Vigna angularis var. angularis TaxID=157739 RepID=A0A0S3RKS2_PHAAN|nr:hypothetical protein VIGAN_03088700 [Vigna angularis var. angularis]